MARADLGDLGRIIERLEARRQLIGVTSEVDPVQDFAGVAAKLEARGARKRASALLAHLRAARRL